VLGSLRSLLRPNADAVLQALDYAVAAGVDMGALPMRLHRTVATLIRTRLRRAVVLLSAKHEPRPPKRPIPDGYPPLPVRRRQAITLPRIPRLIGYVGRTRALLRPAPVSSLPMSGSYRRSTNRPVATDAPLSRKNLAPAVGKGSELL
jgi:hypothetical protein